MVSPYIERASDVVQINRQASGKDIAVWAERRLDEAEKEFIGRIDELYNYGTFSFRLRETPDEIDRIANLISHRVEGLRNHAKNIRERQR